MYLFICVISKIRKYRTPISTQIMTTVYTPRRTKIICYMFIVYFHKLKISNCILEYCNTLSNSAHTLYIELGALHILFPQDTKIHPLHELFVVLGIIVYILSRSLILINQKYHVYLQVSTIHLHQKVVLYKNTILH